MRPLALAALLAASPASAAAPKKAPKAPDFAVGTLLDAPRKSVTLKDLRGKVVFLEFWATWCAPCVAGIPRTNRLIDALAGTDAVFLFVTDEDEATVRGFLGKRPVKAWIGLDQKRQAFGPYRVKGRPDGYLIGRNGELLARVFPDALQEKDVRDALAGAFAPRPVEWADASDAAFDLKKKGKSAPGTPKPLFEITITPQAEKSPFRGMRGGPDGLSAVGLPFQTTIGWIWDFDSDLVILDTEPVKGFDFVLAAPRGDFGAAKEALKAAVTATFGVRAREERQEREVYLLKRAGKSEPPRFDASGPLKAGAMSTGPGRFLGSGPLAELAGSMRWSAGRPVVDETGLKGEYSFDLEWPEADAAARDAAFASVGLKLVPARRKIPVLRVLPAAKD